MTPEQALQFLFEATAGVPGTRDAHEKIKEAIKVLAEAIKKEPGT